MKKARTSSQKAPFKVSASSQQESFHLQDPNDGSTEISWGESGKTMIVVNAKHYLVDENGKREMTSKEHKALEKNVQGSEQQRKHERASREEQQVLQHSEREAYRQAQKEHAMQQQVEKEHYALCIRPYSTC